jgi:hypothetical protein
MADDEPSFRTAGHRMIDLLSTSQVLLKDAGYTVRLSSLQRSSMVCFEDSAVVGFCAVFETPIEMIRKWKMYEDEILVRFSPSFRAAGDKAWNVYCIFLCGTDPTKNEKREVGFIEEGLERTRKIAACGVSSREALVRALLPILPIQNQPVLTDFDVTERLKRRIGDIAPNAKEVALDDAIPAAEIVRLLGERS